MRESGKRVAKAFIDKVPTLLTLAADTPWPEIDERIAPRPDEPVMTKLFASAYRPGVLLGVVEDRRVPIAGAHAHTRAAT